MILLLLAFALAADAFAVALAQGAAIRPNRNQSLLIALAFGSAQAIMPLLGWALGVAFDDLIAVVDHWVAFGLLGVLGLKMVREGLARTPDCPPALLTGKRLLWASFATSIDAAAAGLTLPTLEIPVLLSCAAIGIVTALLCFAGALFGRQLGVRFGKRVEVGGGLVLIAIGTKILIEHLSA